MKKIYSSESGGNHRLTQIQTDQKEKCYVTHVTSEVQGKDVFRKSDNGKTEVIRKPLGK